MKLEVLERIWKLLDDGWNTNEIAETYYINPDIIDSIKHLRKVRIDLEVYG